jgi:hypothetical protein
MDEYDISIHRHGPPTPRSKDNEMEKPPSVDAWLVDFVKRPLSLNIEDGWGWLQGPAWF